MEPPEKIPLDEAVGRGLVPCSVCGATGAAVRAVGGKKHFLCSRCAGRGRWKAWLAAGLGIVAVAALAWALVPARGGSTPPGRPPPGWEVDVLLGEAMNLMRERKFPEGRKRLEEALRRSPGDTRLHGLMAQCLRQMSYFEASIPHWTAVCESDPVMKEEGRLQLGIALSRMARVTESVKYLEKPFEAEPMERRRQMALAECYLELELYQDALKLLESWPPGGGVSWTRHRALSYLGRPDEAREAIESLEGKTAEDRILRSVLRVSQAREGGDFEAARKALQSALGEIERGSPDWARLKRSEIALQIEAGDMAALESAAGDLAGGFDGHVAGVAFWGRALGRLLAGKREEAVAAAREFLTRTDPEFTPLRMERLMMLHLTGELKDEALEAEARATPRSWQNDILFYLALVRGDRSVAERALQATPGHNFPYHAIRRFLGK